MLVPPLYTCPVFQHGVWPDECIACGVPVARRVEAKTLQMDYGARRRYLAANARRVPVKLQ